MNAEEQREENDKQRAELKSAYKRCFDTDDGKKVLKDLMRACGYNISSVSPQSPNALQTMFAEGKRWVYLMIQKKMENENE